MCLVLDNLELSELSDILKTININCLIKKKKKSTRWSQSFNVNTVFQCLCFSGIIARKKLGDTFSPYIFKFHIFTYFISQSWIIF